MESENLLEEIDKILKKMLPQQTDLKDEASLEIFTINSIRPIVQKYHKNLQKHPKSKNEREQIADLSIDSGEILIEIKLLRNINDLYRLFYQTIKYLRITKKVLILFVWDTNNILKNEDRIDLLSLEKPLKILKIVNRIS